MRGFRRTFPALLVCGVLALGVACTPTAPGTPAQASTSSTPGPARYYLSLGDSYAAGYRPTASGHDTSTDGFVYRVADGLARRGTPVVVENLACSGATSTDLMTDSAGCAADRRGPDAPDHQGTTQLAAAVDFLLAHRDEVALLTVSIGGNDVNDCVTSSGQDSGRLSRCLDTALTTLSARLTQALQQLRAAAPDVPLVGLTYPDVYLGLWVKGAPDLATASVRLFRDQLNPVLARAYAAVGATFVDVTAGFGGYGSLTELTAVPPWGSIPRPVEQVCRLTFYCTDGDIHPTAAGHLQIAAEVLDVVPAVR